MIAVGIDVSKAKSTVAVLNSDGSIRAKPFTMYHTLSDMDAMVKYLNDLDLLSSWNTQDIIIIQY